ncbi:MAG: HAMP domain-containing histidine kinase [Firmicutes bacterium]|nr:HAMP domain-containing histidine kinase [Bacillota bacterium]
MTHKKNNFCNNMCDNCEKLKELQDEVNVFKRQIDNLNMSCLNIRKQNFILEEKLKEVEKNNQELTQLQQDKNDLFAAIVHDIKNPTVIIKSLVELLRTYDNNSMEQQAIMNDLVASTKQIVSLSVEISKVLILDANTSHMFYEWASPAQLIADITRRNSINAKNKSQTISIDVAENLPQFQVDVVKICEVFDNMLSNAIKFTQRGGKIGVKASEVDGNIQFEFSDNGLGMSEEDLRKAFKRGQKLSARPTGEGETSSGLGLWIVKKIIEAHKGKVWIKSALGVGTVFTIHIPIEASQAATPL